MALFLALLLWIAQVAMPGFDSNADYYVSRSGWTVFTPTTSGAKQTQKVYVANKDGDPTAPGDDGLCGYAPDLTYTNSTCQGPNPSSHGPHGPKKTIGAGYALLRDTYPDWLLLRCGDTFTITGTFQLGKNGASASERQLISSYGSGARPKVMLAAAALTQFGISTQNRNNIAITDLHIEQQGPTYEATTGYGVVLWNSNNVLVEGCYVTRFAQGIAVGYGSGQSARRNVVTDIGVHGITISGATNALAEDNVIYRIGEIKFQQSSSIYAHCIYITGPEHSDNFIVRGNILATAYHNGIDIRPEYGLFQDNVVVRCGQAISIGDGPTYVWIDNPDLTIQVLDNSFLDGREGFSAAAGESALQMFQGLGHQVSGNVFANGSVGANETIRIRPDIEAGMSLRDAVFRNNVVYQYGSKPVRVTANSGQIQNLRFVDNDVYTSTTDVLIELPGSWINAQWKSGDNRFYTAGSSAWWFMTGGSGQTLDQYKTAVGDPVLGTSASVAMSSSTSAWGFTNPIGASIGGYDAYIGGAVVPGSGLQGGTYENFMSNAVLQRKGFWRPAYTACAVNEYIRQCFGK